VSEDPFGFDGRDVNLYRYVLNKLMISVDLCGSELVLAGCGFEALGGGFASVFTGLKNSSPYLRQMGYSR
jgi:hypothetical protein